MAAGTMASLRSRTTFHLVVGGYSLLCLLPLLWMVVSSFKPTGQILQNPLGLPESWDWEVFVEAWDSGGLGAYVWNSALVTFVSTVAIVLFGSMAAFALSRLRFRGANLLLVLMAIGLLLPIQGYFIAQEQIFDLSGIRGSRWALILPYTAMGLPLAILLIKAYIDTLPRAMFEAARLDGCTDLRMYRTLILPIIRPALVTVAVFSALAAWNEFLLAILYVQDDSLKTIPAGLLAYSSQYSTDYQRLFAALTIVTLPMVAIYVAFNGQIVNGLTQGAVKG